MTTLETLRQQIGTDCQRVLSHIWSHFLEHEEWPMTRNVHSMLGKQYVISALTNANGAIIFESNNGGISRYQLNGVGTLLTENGPSYQALLVRYLEQLRTLFHTQPDKQSLSSEEASSALGISTEECNALYHLIILSHLFSRSASHGQGAWNVGIFIESEDFPNGPLENTLESFLFKSYNPGSLIFYRDQVAHWSRPNQMFSAGNERIESPAFDYREKRYQVFLSSTFTDLKLERQHAVRALLQSNCIPCGMELFPATSTSQWDLIKSVIAECDYFVLILAARYGSLVPGEDVGYTEREFQYAKSLGKPILAFCHENTNNIVLAKADLSDDSRSKLERFRGDVMKLHVNFWSNPEGLESAIKTALYAEIKSNPQRGWIRTPERRG